MLLDTNIKVIITLCLLSFVVVASHRIGLLDTQLSLMTGPHLNESSDITLGNVTTEFSSSNNTLKNRCILQDKEGFNLCGISIGLGEDGARDGLDLTSYHSLELDVAFKAPMDKPHIKVTFRNFHDAYSVPNDYVSLKFNTITYNPSLYESALTVPLNAFQVENWWIIQYQIGFDHSQPDFSNVSYIEFITADMPAEGEYEIEVKEVTLRGQLLTEMELWKCMFVIWLIIIIILITKQRNHLKCLSITDSLTEHYNRRGIEQWVMSGLSKYTVCVFYLDISGFKKINDTYGHAIGDELLIKFANRIQNELYPLYLNKVALSRISGDEFLIALKGLGKHQIQEIIETIFALQQEPFDLGGHKIMANSYLGVSYSSKQANTFDELVKRADSAINYAKKSGAVRFKVFDESVSQDIYFRQQVAEQLKNALAEDQLRLNFMPIFNAHSLKIEAVEVLLRCKEGCLQGIGPDVFIPVAEEYNLIKAIDLWVIEETFKKMSADRNVLFATDGIERTPLVFCINVSAAELHNMVFGQQLRTLLDKYRIEPQWVELEITETSLIEIDERNIHVLEEIRSLGISLALDDFGTGYTAFNQLIHYPIDCLKIDKSFIDYLDDKNETYKSMVQAILHIAKSYQLITIAEGIENAAQYQYLVEHGCDMMQGYLFAKPMEWHDFKNQIEFPQTEALLAKVSMVSERK